MGDSIDHFMVKLPTMPMVFKKGASIVLPVSLNRVPWQELLPGSGWKQFLGPFPILKLN